MSLDYQFRNKQQIDNITKLESAEAEQGAVSEAVPKAITALVETMLPKILANDYEPLAQTSEVKVFVHRHQA